METPGVRTPRKVPPSPPVAASAHPGQAIERTGESESSLEQIPRARGLAGVYSRGRRLGMVPPSHAPGLLAPSPRLPPFHLPSVPPAAPPSPPSLPTGASRPPPWGAKHRRHPRRPGARGPGTASSAGLRGNRRARGVLLRGSPCQGPRRKIPRRPGIPHPTQRSHYRGPSIPQPRTIGSGSLLHRLTDHIWGVKMQNAVQVARKCCGGHFLYGGGLCTTISPYKVGHLFRTFGDILGP